MAIKTLFPVFVVALTVLVANGAATRDVSGANPGVDLTSRLQTKVGIAECWEALSELRSCTDEIILFFFNGQTALGSECCHAINVITHNCWPSLLTSLGYTPEEGNILQGYCKTSSESPAPASAPGVSGPCCF